MLGSLNEIVSVDTVDDDVTNTEVLVTGVTLVVWDGRLVNRPVVEWRIVNWVVELDEIVSINSIDDVISLTKVLVSSITRIMWNRWLVNAPIVEWRIFYRVLNL